MEPVLSGEIPSDGVLDILREIEARRVTGRIRFTATSESGVSQTGEVELVAGQLALDQDALPDGTDPVERLLALRGGLYVVHQRLPPLPVSQGDDRLRTGSLAVHVPADLMNYCEQGGLTGTLKLERGRERVELVYEHGELLAIRVDGRDDGDLSHVFGWDDGTFAVAVNAQARTLVPELAPPEEEDDEPSAREPTTQFVRPRRDDTGRHFLKVLEVALTEIVDQRERARPATRTSPARAKSSTARPRPPSMAAPPAPTNKREPTVRVVYLTPDDPTTAVVPSDLRTRHASARAARDGALPEAQPARRREPSPSEEAAASDTRASSRRPAPAIESSAPVGLGPVMWLVAVIAVGVLALALLGRLPG